MKKRKWSRNVVATIKALDDADIEAKFEDLNGNELKFDIFTCEKATKYGSYLLIRTDLKSALEMLKIGSGRKKAQISGEESIDHSLYLASIITYGKCFSASNGRKCSLESNHIFKNHELLESLHTRIIDLRNNYVAHSGINESEKAHVFGIRSNTNNRYLLIKGITSSAIDDPIEDFENTIKLFEFTLNYVEKKLDILQGSLNRKYYSW